VITRLCDEPSGSRTLFGLRFEKSEGHARSVSPKAGSVRNAMPGRMSPGEKHASLEALAERELDA
jgi:hypothetical protein